MKNLFIFSIFYFQEGINLSIKRDFTMRERIHFNIFKVSVKDIVHQMSLRYHPGQGEIPKQVALTPKITNKVSVYFGLVILIRTKLPTRQLDIAFLCK